MEQNRDEDKNTPTIWSAIWSVFNPLAFVPTIINLRKDGPKATFNRLSVSKHVLDLRLIAGITYTSILIALVATAFLAWHWHKTADPKEWRDDISFLLEVVGALLAFLGAVWAWAYQAASRRLGVVDLFASEITSLCRVATVSDAAGQLTDLYIKARPNAHSVGEKSAMDLGRFTSEEEYFPIFNGHSDELEVLEASVVNNITAFYTYMKAMRDSARRLAATPKADDSFYPDDVRTEPWHRAAINCIYLLFLGFECARQAVKDLIEYPPTGTECTLTILVTELECYLFLIERLHGIPKDESSPGRAADFRFARLWIRRHGYRNQIESLERDLGPRKKRWNELRLKLKKERREGTKAKRMEPDDAEFMKDWGPALSSMHSVSARWKVIQDTIARIYEIPGGDLDQPTN